MLLLYILLFFTTFLFMEFMAWFTHKYIMHGFMWRWHKSHHKVHDHVLEKNDLFAVVFSIPSIALIYLATRYESGVLLSIGLGIAAYGLFYFIFHDIIVHRRINIKFKSNNTYLKRIINAHYAHHKVHTKEEGEAFGFLYAPKKYEVKKAKKKVGK
jgi:beta-carotene 3-hydroxylase